MNNNTNDLVTGNINSGHVIKFIKHVYKEKQYGILVYEIIWLLMIHLYGEMFLDPYYWSDLYSNLFKFGLIVPVVSLWIILNKPGQGLLRFILGARRMERAEHIERLKKPVLAIINEAKRSGLDLPDDIDVYVVNSSEAFAYAIGMNSIIISEGMARCNAEVFRAKILSELYRINKMAPDYLLFMIGSNFVSGIIVLCLVVIARIGMKTGDSRTNFWGSSERKDSSSVFYVLIAVAATWFGFCYLCINKYVKKYVLAADKYAMECGCGNAICTYIDQIKPKKMPVMYKILELGYPSKNTRVSELQNAGVKYFV